MSEKDRGNLLGILDSCAKIQRFTEEMNDADAFYADERTFDAVLMNFVVIGESVSKLSEELLLRMAENQRLPEHRCTRLFWR